MIAPQLPTCVAIRQPLFHHNSYRQRNHTMGVLASAWRYIAQVCHKILVAFLTMMLRIGHMKFDRSSRDQIANIMHLALVHMLSSGGLPAHRARAVSLIAVFFDHPCFGQIFDPLIFDIRLVLARTVFFRWLFGRGWRFHPASLLQNASFGRTFIDRLATVSIFVGAGVARPYFIFSATHEKQITPR